ncbi:MAG: phosphatase [Bacillota bacterium]|nr:phosphatase [Bacillota bacterium]
MTIIADLHTHTNVSDHAYSTLQENCRAAKEKNLYAIAITDHAPAMADGAHPWHFTCLRHLPRRIDGVYILRGAEANIISEDGGIDLEERICSRLDYIIASFHEDCFEPKTREVHTKTLLNILKNPYVSAIGHPGNGLFPFDYEAVISRCNEYKKIIEINNHSFEVRKNSTENCREIALLCKKYRVPIVISSDAHISFDIGSSDAALSLMSEIDFPEELIINSEVGRLRDYFVAARKLDIFE